MRRQGVVSSGTAGGGGLQPYEAAGNSDALNSPVPGSSIIHSHVSNSTIPLSGPSQYSNFRGIDSYETLPATANVVGVFHMLLLALPACGLTEVCSNLHIYTLTPLLTTSPNKPTYHHTGPLSTSKSQSDIASSQNNPITSKQQQNHHGTLKVPRKHPAAQSDRPYAC